VIIAGDGLAINPLAIIETSIIIAIGVVIPVIGKVGNAKTNKHIKMGEWAN